MKLVATNSTSALIPPATARQRSASIPSQVPDELSAKPITGMMPHLSMPELDTLLSVLPLGFGAVEEVAMRSLSSTPSCCC